MTEQNQQPVSVILVEDDQALRESLCEYLNLKGLQVEAVGDAASYYQLLHRKCFQVAVIDLGLPDESGERLIQHARQNSQMSLIVITASDGLNSRVNCYRSGADLFMGKPVHGQELAAAIVSLAERQRTRTQAPEEHEPSATEAWILNSRNWMLVTPDNLGIECTVKEFRLLSMLAETPSVPVKRPRILMALYGRDDDSAQRALDTLVRRLRQKIQLQWPNDNSPIRTVYSVGYLFADHIVVQPA